MVTESGRKGEMEEDYEGVLELCLEITESVQKDYKENLENIFKRWVRQDLNWYTYRMLGLQALACWPLSTLCYQFS